MHLEETEFKGLLLVKPSVFEDERGYFFESWNKKQFAEGGLDAEFVQDNQSKSSRGVLRGLHFQIPPFEQGKLVRVLNGAVLDVVVDLRRSEPTFGRHYKVVLTAKEKQMLWIPPGFAHGFLTLEADTVFFYKCSQFYHRDSERSLAWNDPVLNIDWGIQNPLVSDKDRNAPSFSEFTSPF